MWYLYAVTDVVSEAKPPHAYISIPEILPKFVLFVQFSPALLVPTGSFVTFVETVDLRPMFCGLPMS